MKTPRVHDFDPDAQIPELGSSMENLPTIQKPQPKENKPYQIPERPNVSTLHRPNVRRIITRNSFEIYEDQMDDLRREAYEEKITGGIGSMSKMVRDAIDTYLEKRRAGK
jgi:hypothetical protein